MSTEPAPPEEGQKGAAIRVLEEHVDLSAERMCWFSDELERLVDEAYRRGQHPLQTLHLIRIEYNLIIEEESGDRDAIDELLDAKIDGVDVGRLCEALGLGPGFNPPPRDGHEPRLDGVGLPGGHDR